MFVKICGITNREDALAAIDAGARALGFVFHKPSPRRADPASIEPWISEIPANIWRVGVFVNEAPEAIEQIAANLKLDVAQLHGSETPAEYPRGLRIWKAIRLDWVGAVIFPSGSDRREATLLDGPGNGLSFPWELANSFPGNVIVAGGLTPDNVRDAIAQTNPWGVDTASGVETSPGRKDRLRMKQFIQAALGS
jgi:phosphoribosylanthranilate isomerase